MTESIVNFFKDVDPRLVVILISMIPMIEVRGAIPVAVVFGMQNWAIMLYTWIGSTLIVPIVLLLLIPILKVLKKIKIFSKLALAIENLFTEKANKINNKIESDIIEKRKMKQLVGLFLFVAVPIPVTGTWSGSAVASFLGLPYFKALLSIACGNIVAVLLMTGLSLLFKKYVDYILWGLFVCIFILITVYIIKAIVKSRKANVVKPDDKDESNN